MECKDMAEPLATFIGVIFVTLVYALFYFVTNKISDINKIDWSLLFVTLVVGVAIAIVDIMTGVIPTSENVFLQLGAYAVFIGVGDQIVHQVIWYIRPDLKAQSKAIRSGKAG
jgi:hypothetical protein